MAQKISNPSTLKTDIEENAPVEVLPVKEVRTLLSWKAPARLFKRRDKEFWTTVLAIIFLISLILLFLKEWFLIATIFALAFVYYVLSTVPPEEIEYQLTNRGIRFEKIEYPWEALYRFWISEKWGQKILNIDGRAGFAGRLTLILGSQDEKRVTEIIGKYLLHEEALPTFFDRASEWLAQKIPLEKESKPYK